MENFYDMPIVESVLPWTGKQDGDDEGYRSVPISNADLERPDDLVLVGDEIAQYSVYARGPASKICTYYYSRLTSDPRMFLRAPAYEALLELDDCLRQRNRSVLLLDGFRSLETQRRLFAYLFKIVLKGRPIETLSISEFISAAVQADEVGSYVEVREDARFEELFEGLQSSAYWLEFEELARVTKTPVENLATYYLTIRRNLSLNNLNFDSTAPTAHGSGGAADIFMLSTRTDEPILLGVPFDYVGEASKMSFFENEHNFERYAEMVAKDKILRDFLGQFGIVEPTRDICLQIRDERRLHFHATKKVGGTHYFNECWHDNFGNERGGNQASKYPGGGSSCHSLLKNVRDPRTDEITAVWSNAFAQKRALELTF